jgi:D-alanine-D-alanine ligase
MLSSAVCMDKAMTHTILEAAGIRMARWRQLRASELSDFDRIEPQLKESLGYPMFVKPANEGSSVGVNKAHCREELYAALQEAFRYDSKVVVEETITGAEVECAVFGGRDPFASVVGEIVPVRDLYDYEGKYLDGSTDLYIPARIPRRHPT